MSRGEEKKAIHKILTKGKKKRSLKKGNKRKLISYDC